MPELKNAGRNAFLGLLLLLVLAVIVGPREHGTIALVAICFVLVDVALVLWFLQRRRHP
jgi:hypothetical protein